MYTMWYDEFDSIFDEFDSIFDEFDSNFDEFDNIFFITIVLTNIWKYCIHERSRLVVLTSGLLYFIL